MQFPSSSSYLISHTQCCFEKNPEALLKAKDSQGNTIAHLVAASGKTEVFQVKYLYFVTFQLTS